MADAQAVLAGGRRAGEWRGVTMENGRVVKLELREVGLTGAVPAEIGQLTSLTELNLEAIS